VTKSETRTPTGLVIDHLKCGVLVAITVAIMQNAASNPFLPPKRWAPRIESNTGAIVMNDDGVIQPDIPSSVYFPDIPCGSLAPLIRTAYTSWLIGAKEESKDPESLANSSAMPVTEEAEGSSLNFKVVASPEIATRGGLAAAQLGRRSRRRPDLIGAAQHPGIEQRAIIASCRLILRFWRFVG
jgi:hypothetical protein